NRADGLPAHDDRPIVRHVERDPRADGATRDSTDQRVGAYGAHRLRQRVFQLMPGQRRVDGKVAVPAALELAYRVYRAVDVTKYAQHARGLRAIEHGARKAGELH